MIVFFICCGFDILASHNPKSGHLCFKPKIYQPFFFNGFYTHRFALIKTKVISKRSLSEVDISACKWSQNGSLTVVTNEHDQ